MTVKANIIAVGNYEPFPVPRRIPLVTSDSYATITAPGYINKTSAAQSILPTDIFSVVFNFNETNKQDGEQFLC